MRIRWKGIRRAVRRLTGISDLDLHGSTEMPDTLRACVVRQNGRADIIINLNRAKSETEVIEAVAHEAAHLYLGDSLEDNRHSREWVRMINEIKSALRKAEPD